MINVLILDLYLVPRGKQQKLSLGIINGKEYAEK